MWLYINPFPTAVLPNGLSVTLIFGPPFVDSLTSHGKRFYVHTGLTFVYTEKDIGDFGNKKIHI